MIRFFFSFIDIYETEEDAAGLYVTGPIDEPSSHLFRHPFVYQLNAEHGSFKINEEIMRSQPTSYNKNKKCLVELFNYLRHNVKLGEDVELYCCWAHGIERFSEVPRKELNLIIELSTFQLGDEFDWQERQYICVKRSKLL